MGRAGRVNDGKPMALSHLAAIRSKAPTLLDPAATTTTQVQIFGISLPSPVKGICPRGNNKVLIIIFHVYDKYLFLMLELY
jgi:hypothetical protein